MAASEIERQPAHPTDIASRRFALVRKGYATEEVHAYLRGLAEHVSRLQGEIEWQRARGEHLERRTAAAQEAAYARLSRDFMDVVRQADEAAGKVRAEAELQARSEVETAHRDAARLLAAAAEQAESILTEARAEAERVLREAGGSATAPETGSPSEDDQPEGSRTVRVPEPEAGPARSSSATQALAGLWSDTGEGSRRPPRPKRRPGQGGERSEEDDLDLDLDVSLFDLFEGFN